MRNVGRLDYGRRRDRDYHCDDERDTTTASSCCSHAQPHFASLEQQLRCLVGTEHRLRVNFKKHVAGQQEAKRGRRFVHFLDERVAKHRMVQLNSKPCTRFLDELHHALVRHLVRMCVGS